MNFDPSTSYPQRKSERVYFGSRFSNIPNYIDLVKQNLENTVCFEKCCKFDSRPYFFSEFIENLIHKFPENIKISVGVVHVTDGGPLEVPKKGMVFI